LKKNPEDWGLDWPIGPWLVATPTGGDVRFRQVKHVDSLRLCFSLIRCSYLGVVIT